MGGGIRAWSGIESHRPPGRGMPGPGVISTGGDAVAFAYRLEEGSRLLYTRLAGRLQDGAGVNAEMGRLFEKLIHAEEEHEAALTNACERMGDGCDRSRLMRLTDGGVDGGAVIEGGAILTNVVNEFMKVIGDPALVLETAMGYEADSLDLYMRLADEFRADDELHRLFNAIARGELQHLESLGELLAALQ